MHRPTLNIKALRLRHGITQSELAHRLNVNQEIISRYETGLRQPPSHRLPLIARALGVEVGELFTPPSPAIEHNAQVHG